MEIIGYILIAVGVGALVFFWNDIKTGKGAIGIGCGFLTFAVILTPAVILIAAGCIIISRSHKKKEEQVIVTEYIDRTPTLPQDPPEQITQPPTYHLESEPDWASQLRKYKELADEGIITQEEFELKKRQLLQLDDPNRLDDVTID